MTLSAKTLAAVSVPDKAPARPAVKSSWTKSAYSGPGVGAVQKGTFKNEAGPVNAVDRLDFAKETEEDFQSSMDGTLAHASKAKSTSKKH